ncbi:MAG: fibronectin type III domain-containing protein [Spirochaetes bacterium]|uniref:Fibronectin type III domain-containing protein n=1 Tax=Candidatus Aphodenecus pullistercoris TaxID=2840669 RepID=A0A9D9E931_9SPIR|nr:fibronectin type III domain-containing protein [Candidatus Aphodenecus pullistercoris]
MRRRVFPAIVVAIILLLCACSQDDAMRGRTLSIALEGVAQPGARTILPDGYVQPTKFDVTLTAEEGNGETRTYKDLTLSAGSLTLTDVKLGTYTVSIDGKSDDGTTVMKGEGDKPLVVTPTTVSNVTVKMDVISNSGSGTIKVVFDWSAAKDNERLTSYLDSGDGLTFKMYDVATGKELGSTEAIKGSNKTSATLTATIDLGKAEKNEFDVYYKLYSGATLITDKLRRSTAHVYAGNTSVDDEDEIIITDDDVSWGVNVRNAAWSYVKDDSTKIQISWDNVFSRGTQIFDHVVVSWQRQDGTGEKNSATAYFRGAEKNVGDFNFAADSETGSITISNLKSDVPYSVSIQAFQTNGMVSPDTVTDFTIQTKVIVDSITTTQSEFSTTAGESIDINWTVNPPDASITAVEISGTNEAFEVTSKDDSTVNGNAKVKVNKAGVNTLTVKSSDRDSTASATTYTVKAKLTTPTGVKAEKQSDGILVSWNEVNDAAGYSVQKYKNGSVDGEAVLVTNGTSWTDKNVFSSQSYHYTVTAYNEALNQDGFTADSASATTDAVTMPQSVISVDIPSSGSKLEINITAKDGILALYEDSSLTFSAVGEDGTPIEGMEYAWYFNVEEKSFSTSATVEITKAYEKEHFDTEQTSGVQTIKLEITTEDGMTYSGSVNFYNITTPEKSIAITLPEGYSNPDSVVRVASETYDETEGKAKVRQIKLVTKFEPSESTLKNVWYTSSDTGIATVSSDGTVTFTNTKFGTVEITARSASGKTDTVTFDVYGATVASVEEFINAINSIYGAKLAEADDYFYAHPYRDDLYTGWRTSWPEYYLNYDSDDFHFSRLYGVDNYGDSSIDEREISSNAIGDITISTTGNITLAINSSKLTLFLTNCFVSAIGANTKSDGDIEVILPSNQGIAKLHYNNVSFNSGNQESWSGSFTVTFDKSLGYNNEIEAKKSYSVDYKQDAGIDSIHAIVKPGAAS